MEKFSLFFIGVLSFFTTTSFPDKPHVRQFYFKTRKKHPIVHHLHHPSLPLEKSLKNKNKQQLARYISEKQEEFFDEYYKPSF